MKAAWRIAGLLLPVAAFAAGEDELATVPVDAAATASPPESAETPANSRGLGEIIVTANFRAQSAQDVAGSIAGFDDERIRELGVSDIGDLTTFTPSLNNNDRGPGRNDMNVRGIGRLVNFLDYVPTPNPIGYYLDDVSINTFSSAQGDVSFYGISRVEVLRGPQGTLYGESAEGGAVKFVTQDPDLDEFSTGMEMEGSRWDDGKGEGGVRARVNLPLVTDMLGMSLHVGTNKTSGFIDNISATEPKKNINDYRSRNGRLILRADPSDSLSIRLAYHYDGLRLGAAQTVDADTLGRSEDEMVQSHKTSDDYTNDTMRLIPLKVSYDFGPVAVESISGYFNRQADRYVYNGVVAFFTTILAGSSTGTASDGHMLDENDYRQYSEELRFISNFEGPFNFIVGAYYKQAKTEASFYGTSKDVDLIIADTGLDQKARQFSLYSELSWEVSEKWSATAGIRMHRERLKTADNPTNIYGASADGLLFGLLPIDEGDLIELPRTGLPPIYVLNIAGTKSNIELKDWLPMVRMEYRATDDALLYARYATGLRNGNVNTPFDLFVYSAANLTSSAPFTTYGSDFVQNYELGAKMALLDGDLIVNSALYYNDWTDLQILINVPLPLTVNTASAASYGLEIESQWRLNESLSFFFGGTVSRAKTTSDFVIPATITSPAETIESGRQLPYSQKHSFSTGVAWTQRLGGDLTLQVRPSYSYIGPYVQFLYNGLVNDDVKSGDYGLANLAADFKTERWTLTLQVTNLFNRIEQISSFPLTAAYSSFTGLPMREGQSLDDVYINSPRCVRLTLGYNFAL